MHEEEKYIAQEQDKVSRARQSVEKHLKELGTCGSKIQY